MAQIASLEGKSSLRLLEQCATEVIFQSDEEICPRGSAARYYWRVIEGCVRTFNLTGDGRRQIEDFLLPGDVLGLDHLRTAPSAADPGCFLTISVPRRVVVELLRVHP